MKYNIYDKQNIEDSIQYYYTHNVSHKETYEKFNIKRATYFLYLKIYKESDYAENGSNKKYEDFQKINRIFQRKAERAEQEKMNKLQGVRANNAKHKITEFVNHINRHNIQGARSESVNDMSERRPKTQDTRSEPIERKKQDTRSEPIDERKHKIQDTRSESRNENKMRDTRSDPINKIQNSPIPKGSTDIIKDKDKNIYRIPPSKPHVPI